MKTLTVQQPWAWAIIHGGKDVENRPWNCRFRGRFYVHAGLRLSDGGLEWMEQELGLRGPADFQYAVIIGTAELYDVGRNSDSRWAGTRLVPLATPRPEVPCAADPRTWPARLVGVFEDAPMTGHERRLSGPRRGHIEHPMTHLRPVVRCVREHPSRRDSSSPLTLVRRP